MALIPWRGKQRDGGREAVSPMTSLRAEMDRLFDSFLREPLSAIEWPFGPERPWTPTVDVAESDQEVIVRAEVPGIDPNDLDITIAGNQLVLAGEKKELMDRSGKDFRMTESRYGTFRRTIPLATTVDQQDIDADYSNGVLTIRLKKTPAVPPKRIEVKTT